MVKGRSILNREIDCFQVDDVVKGGHACVGSVEVAGLVGEGH